MGSPRDSGRKGCESHVSSRLLAATHRKTKVPAAPRPSTSLGLKEIFPTTVSCSARGRGGQVSRATPGQSRPALLPPPFSRLTLPAQVQCLVLPCTLYVYVGKLLNCCALGFLVCKAVWTTHPCPVCHNPHHSLFSLRRAASLVSFMQLACPRA